MMMLHTNLRNSVAAGTMLKPWLMLGPLFENVSGIVPGLT
jgi:hypothetical protein